MPRPKIGVHYREPGHASKIHEPFHAGLPEGHESSTQTALYGGSGIFCLHQFCWISRLTNRESALLVVPSWLTTVDADVVVRSVEDDECAQGLSRPTRRERRPSTKLRGLEDALELHY
jgi:hypothetical protein